MRSSTGLLKTITLSLLLVATGGITQGNAKAGQVALGSESALLDLAFYGFESGVNLGDFAALRKAQDIVVSNNDGDVSFDFTHSASFLGTPDRIFVDLSFIDSDFDLPNPNSIRSSRGTKGLESSVPEPASMLLLGTSLCVAVGVVRARRRRKLS